MALYFPLLIYCKHEELLGEAEVVHVRVLSGPAAYFSLISVIVFAFLVEGCGRYNLGAHSGKSQFKEDSVCRAHLATKGHICPLLPH